MNAGWLRKGGREGILFVHDISSTPIISITESHKRRDDAANRMLEIPQNCRTRFASSHVGSRFNYFHDVECIGRSWPILWQDFCEITVQTCQTKFIAFNSTTTLHARSAIFFESVSPGFSRGAACSVQPGVRCGGFRAWNRLKACAAPV